MSDGASSLMSFLACATGHAEYWDRERPHGIYQGLGSGALTWGEMVSAFGPRHGGSESAEPIPERIRVTALAACLAKQQDGPDARPDF